MKSWQRSISASSSNALIWLNAVAGRIWCGYFGPQTVWTDLSLLVERRVEGDRRERLSADLPGAFSRSPG